MCSRQQHTRPITLLHTYIFYIHSMLATSPNTLLLLFSVSFSYFYSYPIVCVCIFVFVCFVCCSCMAFCPNHIIYYCLAYAHTLIAVPHMYVCLCTKVSLSLFLPLCTYNTIIILKLYQKRSIFGSSFSFCCSTYSPLIHNISNNCKLN